MGGRLFWCGSRWGAGGTWGLELCVKNDAGPCFLVPRRHWASLSEEFVFWEVFFFFFFLRRDSLNKFWVILCPHHPKICLGWELGV